MHNESNPLAAEREFFGALMRGDVKGLDQVLGEEFQLIDVMTGSLVTKPDLLQVLSAGQLKFESIEQVESQHRIYGETAVVTGRTQMSGRFGETPFATRSRYTHVYVRSQSQWRLVSAQGTQITNG